MCSCSLLSFPFTNHQIARLLSLALLIESPHYSKLQQDRTTPIWVGAAWKREIWLYLISPKNDRHMKKRRQFVSLLTSPIILCEPRTKITVNQAECSVFCSPMSSSHHNWRLLPQTILFDCVFTSINWTTCNYLTNDRLTSSSSSSSSLSLSPASCCSFALANPKKLWMNEFETSSCERMSTSCSLLFHSNCRECRTLHALSRRYQFLYSTMERFLCFSNLMMDIIKSNREKRTLNYNYMRMKLKIRHFFVRNFIVCFGLLRMKLDLFLWALFLRFLPRWFRCFDKRA